MINRVKQEAEAERTVKNSVATRAEVSNKSRHVITHKGSYSLIFPHIVVKLQFDHLAQDTSRRSYLEAG